MKDVGRPKAEVAAQRIMERIKGVTVTPHFCRIEEKPISFYEQFHIIILGLDSLEARRYMNQVACSFLGRFQWLCSCQCCRLSNAVAAVMQAHMLSLILCSKSWAWCYTALVCLSAHSSGNFDCRV